MLDQEIQATLRQLERLKAAMVEESSLIRNPKRQLGQIQASIDNIRRLNRVEYKSTSELQLDAVELALQRRWDERLVQIRNNLRFGKSLTTEQEQYLLRIS